MDFMSDQLANGHRIWVLTIVDVFSRESLALYASQSIKGYDVVAVLDKLLKSRGKPKTIQVDNGSEFTSKAMDQWAYFNKVEMDFSRPGKPTDKRAASLMLTAPSVRSLCKCPNQLRPHDSIVDPHVVDHAGPICSSFCVLSGSNVQAVA